MNWRWVSVTALLAALVLGYGVLNQRRAELADESLRAEQPGYYLHDAVITQTQEDGSLGLRLIADRIEERREEKGFALRTVRVNYFQAPGQEWLLTAERGFVPERSRILELEGDVELRPADAKQATFLRTDALAIDTEQNLAYSTSTPVRLRFGPHAMIAERFRADLGSDNLRLESVNGRFQPE